MCIRARVGALTVRCVAGVHTSLRTAGGGEGGREGNLPSQVPTLMTRKWCLARSWRVFSNAPAVPPPYLFEFPPRNSHSDQVLGDFFSFLVVVKSDTEAKREVRTLLPDWPSPTHPLTHSPRWTVIISICTDRQAAPGRTLIGKGGREPSGRGGTYPNIRYACFA